MRSGQVAGMVGGGYAALTWFDNCLLQSSHKLLEQNLTGYRYGIQEECAASNRLVAMEANTTLEDSLQSESRQESALRLWGPSEPAMQSLPGRRKLVFNGITSHRASRPKTPFAKRLKRLMVGFATNV